MNKIKQLTAHLRLMHQRGQIITDSDDFATALNQIDIASESQPPIDNKAVDEWISVEDRLPDVGQEVLCIQEVTETALMAVYTDLGFKVQKYASPNDRSYVPYWLGVTLWMPLPTKTKQPAKIAGH